MKGLNKKEIKVGFLIPFICLFIVFIYNIGAQNTAKPEWTFYRVQGGDSIFSIAQNVCDPEDKQDPRRVAYEIQEKNKVEGMIFVDQVIEIPLYTTPEAKREELREFSKTIQPGQI